MALSCCIGPSERQFGRHAFEEACDGVQQTLQGAVQAIGGDLALESEPDVLDRIEMRAVLGQVEQLEPGVLGQPVLDSPAVWLE